MYNKILLPTDGSEFAEKAEKHALFIAEASGAEIIALSVVETSFSIGLPSDDTIFHINQLLKKESEKNLQRVEKIREEANSNVKMTLKVDEGSPAEVILDNITKENIDLVIMGSSGKSGFDKFIMGSVAEKVVKAAKCSVLLAQ
ncbi:TRAP-T-associated universal stress protein TeaD [Methanobrevibacter cuticularis]|uniref:TRAP-T-associated universal stress protein TeaD n=1 Tax=Methanobrevibacter cuticularis TaxID=47311 RepID=A0A166D3V3_9EURY|nr:universal stress protein [Methanobrevibacter cuticularis]KZX15173.1 TRAP-T-associated universal stress protein TeaD [Methanobrevibacter cuticularis]